jgi:hypothetical protein
MVILPILSLMAFVSLSLRIPGPGLNGNHETPRVAFDKNEGVVKARFS